MKKVLNIVNSSALRRLNDDFVSPLIDIFVSAKEECTSVRKSSIYVKLTREKASVINSAFEQIVVAKSKLTFEEECDQFVVLLGIDELKYLRATFLYQTRQLDVGNYSLSVVKFKASVKRLFASYIYEVLFDNEDIWNSLNLPQLKRELFHDNFRRDNDYPASCPYCDLDTINSRGSIKIEHLLPKSKFPLLSVYPLNLLSACESCNSGGFGKGSKVVTQLASPYFCSIGETVDFQFDQLSHTVFVDACGGELGTEGFLSLLNLKKRYQQHNIGIQLHRRMDAFISTVSHIPKNAGELREYLEKCQAGAPFTVALTYWLENVYFPANGI